MGKLEKTFVDGSVLHAEELNELVEFSNQLSEINSNKLDKEDGKTLSSNDFTNEYKEKVDSIEADAQKNTVLSVAGKKGSVSLSKSDVGLNQVDNTSDEDKPLSKKMREAIEKLERSSGGFYNVTKQHPLTSGYYTKNTAIAAIKDAVIPDENKSGTIITFEASDKQWKDYRFESDDISQFATASLWKPYQGAIKKITVNNNGTDQAVTPDEQGNVNIEIQSIDVDSVLNGSSTNPIQNKAVSEAFGQIKGKYGSEVILNEISLGTEKGYSLSLLDEFGEVMSTTDIFTGGGGSSGGVSSVLKLTPLTSQLTTVTPDSESIIGFNFSSRYSDDDSETGPCTITYRVNNLVVEKSIKSQGDVYWDAGKYLKAGSNNISVMITDSIGNSRSTSFSMTLVNVSLSSTFNDIAIYNGPIEVKYTPIGSIEKTVHFILDDVEIHSETTTVTNRQLTYTIPAQSHGNHLLEMYISANVNGSEIESNKIFFDIICVEEGSTDTIIASNFSLTECEQYQTISIPYIVYTPNSDTSSVLIKMNGETINTQSVGRAKQTINIRLNEYGTQIIEISSGTASRQFTVNVSESELKLEAEKVGLELYMTSSGRSNNDTNRGEWKYNTTSATMTGFNFVTNGWIANEDGSVGLKIAGDARVTVPFYLFNKDFKASGKTIEFEFEIKDVADYDTVLIDCMQNGVGLKITAQEASFSSEQIQLSTKYKENNRVRVAFVVESSSENRFVYIYINGIMSGVHQYTTQDNFTQQSPLPIKIGSGDCAITIYNIRVYNTALNQFQILDNYIADMDNFDEKISLYVRNQIYDDYGDIDYVKACEFTPCMTIIGSFPTYKGDKKTVSINYEDKLNPDKSFTSTNVEIDVQGTSSQGYPRKNFKTKHKGGFTMTESGNHSDTFKIHEDSLPVSVFCEKADFAESSSTHNTGLSRLVGNMLKSLGFLTPPQQQDSRIRTTIDGFPILMFHKENESSTPVFVGKYNFNNDKSTQETFGFDGAAECWEVLNNTSDRVRFKSANFSGTDWLNDFEGRYPDGNTNGTNLKKLSEWIVSTIGNPTKFKAEAKDHFNINFLLFYAIVTEMYGAIDQRAKNMMLASWGNEGSGEYKWYPIFYDSDTIMGINNEGLLSFDYTIEYKDANTWNGSDSTLWVNVEEAFSEEIASLYFRMRSEGSLSFDKSIYMFDDEQASKWCEAVYNMDAKYKYIDPLLENSENYLDVAQGSRTQHRSWWLHNRFRFIDSKYNAGDFRNDFGSMRLYTPSGEQAVQPNHDFYITQALDQYVQVKYGSYMSQRIRAYKNETTHVPKPTGASFNDTETYIYGITSVKSIGDLSGHYCGSVDLSKAVNLTELIIGNSTNGYSNPFMTSLSLGNNTLLRKLNIENCPNLKSPINLSGCDSIEEVYAAGSSISSVQLPKSGVLRTLSLPSTITNLTVLNQPNLSKIDITGADNLIEINLDGSNITNSWDIVKQAASKNLSRIRLLNIDASDSSLDTIYKLTKLNGLDELGNITSIPTVTGKLYVTNASGSHLQICRNAFPNLEISYYNLLPATTTTFKFTSSQSKAITNAKFTCNIEYTKVNETTYTVEAENGVEVNVSFVCDNHQETFQTYIVSGTRTQSYVVSYMPMRTIYIYPYNTSTTRLQGRIVLDNGEEHRTDASGYIYIRDSKPISGVAYSEGREKTPFSFGPIEADTTQGIVTYIILNASFKVTDSLFGGGVSGATLIHEGNTYTSNYDGMFENVVVPYGLSSYEVYYKDSEIKEGTISRGPTSLSGYTTMIISLPIEHYIPKPEDDTAIYMKIRQMTQSLPPTLYITSESDGFIIDWGDNTTTVGVKSQTLYSHVYPDNTNIYDLKIHNCENITSANLTGNDSSSRASLVGYLSIGNSKVSGLSFYISSYDFLNLVAVGRVFKNDINRTSFENAFYNKSKLKAVASKLFENCSAATTFLQCFQGCSSLTTLPEGLFSGCTAATNFTYCFRSCTSLTTLPEKLFEGCVLANDFLYCFQGCTALTTISKGVFDGCTAATNFTYCFDGCTSLKVLPEGLFSGCTAATNFTYCFRSCTSLTTLPEKLFEGCESVTNFSYCFYSCTSIASLPESLFSGCTAATNFTYCFYNCTALTIIPEKLFEGCMSANLFSYCFTGCTSITTIPEKLFEGSSAKASFNYCFYSCTSLATIPEKLFSGHVESTTFANCFQSCYSLTTIPEKLFEGCVEVITFANCFSGCKGLTTVPEGLFSGHTKVTTFASCFQGCSSLTTLPEGLFSGCVAATDFGSCFQGCTSLATISEGVFDGCTAATTFQHCFSGCKGLTTVPEGLFSGCTAVTSFATCFQGCSALTTVPEGLFSGHTKVTTFASCFQGCSSLTTLPEGLFSGCVAVTTFASCFQSCSSLKIPSKRLFDGCIKATDFAYCFANVPLEVISEEMFKGCKAVTTGFSNLFYNYTTITKIEGGVFLGCSGVTTFAGCFSGCTSLKTISEGLFNGCLNATTFSSCFYNCTSLEAIPNWLFVGLKKASTFQSCFGNCSSLTEIPEGLFSGCVAVTNFNYCFQNQPLLTTIPEELFVDCVEVTTFSSCFASCTSLKALPEGLFDNCTKVTTFRSCFGNCPSLTELPEGLFSGCTAVIDFLGCFDSCSSLKALPEGLFDNCTKVTMFHQCFKGCSSLTTIPRGLFEKCVAVTTFSYCFQNCSSLTSFPEGVFSGCVAANTFSYCFDGCSALTTISEGVFDGCAAATNFTNCFSNCTSLKTVSERLFDNCTKATTFQQCFWNCSSLTTVPKELFKGCVAVNDFSACFRNCSALTTISEGVFDGCTAATNFSYCFESCISLTSISEELFKGCVAVTNFNYCFQNCLSLTSIPEGLFDDCTKVSGLHSCFENCSKITHATIPELITSLGSYTYRGCTSLQFIISKKVAPPSLGSYSFDDTNNCPIYVPDASLSSYKGASGWNVYASRITPISQKPA